MDISTIVQIATAVITAASIVIASLPRPKPGSSLAVIYNVIDYLALNIGHAARAPSESAATVTKGD